MFVHLLSSQRLFFFFSTLWVRFYTLEPLCNSCISQWNFFSYRVLKFSPCCVYLQLYLFIYFEGDSKIFQVVTLHNTKYHEIWWNRNEHTCMANKHKLVIGSCIGSKANHKCYQKKKKKSQHLHDDGFLGHFSLLFSDYKENSMNSMGLKKGKSWND